MPVSAAMCMTSKKSPFIRASPPSAAAAAFSAFTSCASFGFASPGQEAGCAGLTLRPVRANINLLQGTSRLVYNYGRNIPPCGEIDEFGVRIMKFTKMHGCGNDYVYVNCFAEDLPAERRPEFSRRVSDRHFGAGSDGLICICPSDKADFMMDMYNADGSRAQMCGNGTGAGVKTLWLNVEGGVVESVRVCMGSPVFEPARIPVEASGTAFIDQPIEVAGMLWNVTAVSVGNPHAVVFVDDVDWLDLPTTGPLFENHPLFPERCNIEFAEVLSPEEITMRVWERGAGETLACGTGACATLVAAVLNGLAGRSARLRLLGGNLDITWSDDDNHVYMSGGAVTVFDGEWLL